jgi:hypothetical protein
LTFSDRAISFAKVVFPDPGRPIINIIFILFYNLI